MKKTQIRLVPILLSFMILLTLTTPALATASTKYKLTGNGADDIIAVAKAQEGKTGGELGWKDAWCVRFARWAGWKAGANFPSRDIGRSQDLIAWFVNNNAGTFYYFRDGNYQNLISDQTIKNKNLCVKSSRTSFTPQRGDIIFYLWPEDVGNWNWSHTGIVDSYSNGTIKTVEGNTSGGKVAYRTRNFNPQVVGIVRPNYATASNPEKPPASSVTLTLKQNSVTVKPGNQAKINFTFTGNIGTVECSISDDSICERVGGEWKQSQQNGSVVIKALTPGTTNIKILLKDKSGNVLASKTVCVTVENNITLSANVSNITLDLLDKNSQNVTLTLGGDFPECEIFTSHSDSRVATSAWDTYKNGNVLPAIITAKNIGTTTITYLVKDMKGQDTFATKSIIVTVTAPSYTVRYDVNGGKNAPESQTKIYQQALTLSGVQPTREGYTFAGWATSSNGSVKYHPGEQYTENQNVTLYAVWTPSNNVTLTLKESSFAIKSSEQLTIDFTFTGNIDSADYSVRDKSICEYVQGEWKQSKQHGTMMFEALSPGITDITINLRDKNGKILASKTATVTVSASTYTISYDANGGSGAPSSQTKLHQKSLALSSAQPTRTGYTFNGWSSAPGGSVQFRPGDTYNLDQSATLYAVWQLQDKVTLTLEQNSFTVEKGTQFAVNYSFSGKIGKAAFDVDDESVCGYISDILSPNKYERSLTFFAKTAGETNITITLFDENGSVIISKSTVVTVTNSKTAITGIEIWENVEDQYVTDTTIEIYEGYIFPPSFEAIVASDVTSEVELTWRSSNPAVLAIDSPHSKSTSVTVKQAGTATVTVEATDGSASASCTVQIQPLGIAIFGPSSNNADLDPIKVGESVTISVVARTQNKFWVPTCFIDDTTIATVDRHWSYDKETWYFTITAKAPGDATITAAGAQAFGTTETVTVPISVYTS